MNKVPGYRQKKTPLGECAKETQQEDDTDGERDCLVNLLVLT